MSNTPQILQLPLADSTVHMPVALIAPPASQPPKAALLVIHEAFAVTPHILSVAQDYAAQGYFCLVPDLFTRGRAQEAAQLGHANPLWEHFTAMPSLPVNAQGLALCRQYMAALPKQGPGSPIADLGPCLDWLAANHAGLPIGIIGYCFGGSMAYAAGITYPHVIKAAVSYYGGALREMTEHAQPRCPTLIHLAELDRYIPIKETTAALHQHHPAAEVHVYAADHGFNRTNGVTYDPAAAQLARHRSLDFLTHHLT